MAGSSFTAWLVFLCPAGSERSLGLRIERSPPTRLRVRPSRDVPRWGPSLFVRSHASDTPPRDTRSVTRSLRRHGRWHPPGGLDTSHPSTTPWRAGGGLSIRRCRGWQISPEPAGVGRASRVGETAARPHVNAEGPRRGSRPPVAGAGVCGRSARGRTRPHPATRGAGNSKPPKSGEKELAAHPRGKKERSGSDLRTCEPEKKKRREAPAFSKVKRCFVSYLSSTVIEIDLGLASSRLGSVRCSTPWR